ncbi:unnamed protein product [Macrosiphum euphorbiae]|uniref:Uncharacterized protein n=1 Tax=Macrosiphum euphorbiae TaxID=13131 RepID=A0AAV0VSR0_9HEMI|nr:unnamed protein product [Macrosiphum euphorbiae]
MEQDVGDVALTLLKLGSTAYYISLELYIYCYLFDNMNIQRELVNFSIYSANWTQMDLKFKKLLLLAMRMNDANNLVIRATPKKIINLQIFASVLTPFCL